MNIEFYELPDGSRPAMEFIQSLDPKMEAKMIHTIDMLEEHGGALREPYSKRLGEGIFELRAQEGYNISRELNFVFVGNSAVLTHGFIKKRQKTPPREIERAKRYRNDYEAKEGR